MFREVRLARYEAGSEGSDDRLEAGEVFCRQSNRNGEYEGADHEAPLDPQELEKPEEVRADHVANGDHNDQEPERLGRDGEQSAGREVPFPTEHSGDHTKDDQPDHVVDHGGTDDGFGLVGVKPAQIGEYPGGDPDAGCRHRRTHEDGEFGRSTPDREQLDREESQRKRGYHTHERDQQGRRPQPGEGAKIRLESDLEQEQDDADLSKGGQQTAVISAHPAEHTRPDDGSDEQLPNDGRLSKAGHDLRADFGRDEDYQQLDETLENFHRNSRPGTGLMLGDSKARPAQRISIGR